jgi:hypothetical protein
MRPVSPMRTAGARKESSDDDAKTHSAESPGSCLRAGRGRARLETRLKKNRNKTVLFGLAFVRERQIGAKGVVVRAPEQINCPFLVRYEVRTRTLWYTITGE